VRVYLKQHFLVLYRSNKQTLYVLMAFVIFL